VSSEPESGLWRVGDCSSAAAVDAARAACAFDSSGGRSPEVEIDEGRYFRTGTGGGTRLALAPTVEVDCACAVMAAVVMVFVFKCVVVLVESTVDVAACIFVHHSRTATFANSNSNIYNIHGAIVTSFCLQYM